MNIAVVSSIYGGYDQPLPPPAQTVGCRWILVTDREYPDLQGWEVVVEPRPQLHPRLAAKVAKCRPDLYADADAYVWVDGSFALRSAEFVEWAVSYLEHGLLAQIPHPRRFVMDEAVFSVNTPGCASKYIGLPLVQQAQSYLMDGFPDGWGMWCTGLIVSQRDKVIRELGDAWLREQMRWSYQDQVSQAPVLHSLGLRPVDIDMNMGANAYFDIRWQGEK